MRRLLGLLLVIRAFAPVLAILVILWGIGQMTADFQRVVNPRVERIETELADLEKKLQHAQAEFETARTHITAALEALQAFQIPDLLPNFPDSIALPRITIPDPSIRVPNSVSIEWSNFSYVVEDWVPNDCGFLDFLCDAGDWVLETVTRVASYPSDINIGTRRLTLTIPDLPNLSIPMPDVLLDLRDGLASVFDELFGIFDIFDGTLASLRALGDTLQVVPDTITAIGDGFSAAFDSVGRLATRWGGLLLIVLVLLGSLVAVNIIVPMLDDLTRGLRMLFGALPAK